MFANANKIIFEINSKMIFNEFFFGNGKRILQA